MRENSTLVCMLNSTYYNAWISMHVEFNLLQCLVGSTILSQWQDSLISKYRALQKRSQQAIIKREVNRPLSKEN